MGRPKGIDLSARNYRNLSAAMDEILNPREALSSKARNVHMTDEERRERARLMRQASRAAAGGRQHSGELSIEAAASLQYLKTQWGFKSTTEAVNVALRYMATETRKGLQKIDLGVPDDPT